MSDAAPLRAVALRELGALRRGFVLWLVPMAGMIALVCSIQPQISGQGGLLEAKLRAMSPTLREAFGVYLVDFRRPAAYLATSFMYVVLTSSLVAGLFGAAVIAREETLHTAEVLYAQPVSRARVLAGKLIALVTYATAYPLALGVVAAGILGAVADRPLELGLLASMFAGAAALAWCFAGLGMLVAALVRDARSAAGAALGVVLGTYFAGMASALSSSLAWLAYLSPYKLADASATVARGGLDPARTAALAAIGAAAALAAIARYTARDIHA